MGPTTDVLIAGALLGAWVCVAQPEASSLEWNAPSAACPDQAEVIRRVETLLGHPLATTTIEIHAAAAVHPAPKGGSWTMALTISSASGQRTRQLSGGTCAAVADAAALLVAVAIDPGVALRAAKPTAESDPDSHANDAAGPQAPSPDPDAPHTAEDRIDRRTAAGAPQPTGARSTAQRTVGGALRLASGVEIGSLPSAAPLLAVSGALTWRTLRVELAAQHRFAREVRVPSVPGARGRLWVTVAILGACWVPQRARVQFPLCAGLEAGSVAGRSYGITRPARGRGPWAALRAGPGVIFLPWKRMGVVLEATAVAPLTRTGFAISGVGEVHRAGKLGGQFTAGIEARFP